MVRGGMLMEMDKEVQGKMELVELRIRLGLEVVGILLIHSLRIIQRVLVVDLNKIKIKRRYTILINKFNHWNNNNGKIKVQTYSTNNIKTATKTQTLIKTNKKYTMMSTLIY